MPAAAAPVRDAADAQPSEVQALLDLIAGIASASAPVLVMGGNGAGAHLVADLLHAYSRRANQPLLKVSCASLTADLLDSGALFDVVRGGRCCRGNRRPLRPYAGPVAAGAGRPRAAAGRIARHRRRVIATTSADLLAAVRVGAFREDLLSA